MNSMADALVYVVTYIGTREAEDEDLVADDDSAVSHIMAYLLDVTPTEIAALAGTARKSCTKEQLLITLPCHDGTLLNVDGAHFWHGLGRKRAL